MEPAADPTDRAPETKPGGSSSGAQVGRWAQDYARDLRRFLAKRRLIESDIKDVCQEVYLRLLRFDRAENVRNPAAYLFRVAANVAHDFRLSRPDHGPLDVKNPDDMGSDVSVEELADADERRAALFKALEALPPVPRAVLALQAREDISHEEIARRLGISRRALRKAVTRGHELLRVALAKDL